VFGFFVESISFYTYIPPTKLWVKISFKRWEIPFPFLDKWESGKNMASNHTHILLLALALFIVFPVSAFSANLDDYGLIVATEEFKSPTPIADFVSAPMQKSPARAFLYSAVIPGSGELYVGKKRGIAFIVTEIALWSAYAVLHNRAGDLRDDYVRYVDEHIAFESDSPATSTEKWTLEDYEHATQADNWHYVYTDNAGKPVDRVGKFYWGDLPVEMIHENGEVALSESNSEYRVVAYGKRESANTKYKHAKMYLSMVVVNHIVSAIDARIAAVLHNKGLDTKSVRISSQPSIFATDRPNIQLTLYNTF